MAEPYDLKGEFDSFFFPERAKTSFITKFGERAGRVVLYLSVGSEAFSYMGLYWMSFLGKGSGIENRTASQGERF